MMIKQILSCFLLLTLLPIAVDAQEGKNDWNRVEKLKPKITIIVETTNGARIAGEVQDVLRDYLYVLSGKGVERIERSNIAEIRKVKTHRGRKILYGVLIGAGAGYVIGRVAESEGDRQEDPGLIPFFTTCAGAMVGGGATALEQMIGKTQLVYSSQP